MGGERGGTGNFLHEHKRALIAGSVALATIATISVGASEEAQILHGAVAQVDTDYLRVYPARHTDGTWEWPFFLGPRENDPDSYLATNGQRFEPTAFEQEAAIIRQEARDAKTIDHTCKDGTRIEDFIVVGDLSRAEIEENLCGDVTTSADAKKSKEIQATGKKAGRAKPGGAKPYLGGTAACMKYKDGDRILCKAEKYRGIYYRWAGGHDKSYKSFIRDCSNPRKQRNDRLNVAYARSVGRSATHGGNPHPCGLDCSGIVSVAVNAAFNQREDWLVRTLRPDSDDWKHIPMSQARRGDVVTKGPATHVEIVRHMRGRVAHTSGSHRTGKAIGNAVGVYEDAYRYIGDKS